MHNSGQAMRFFNFSKFNFRSTINPTGAVEGEMRVQGAALDSVLAMPIGRPILMAPAPMPTERMVPVAAAMPPLESQQISFAAESLFGLDNSTIRPEGKTRLTPSRVK